MPKNRRKKSPLKLWWRKTRHNAAYYTARTLIFCSSVLPRKAGLCIGYATGLVFAAILSKDRKIAFENINTVYGSSWPRKKIKRMSWKVFGELGKNAFDAFYLSGKPWAELQKLAEVNNLEEFKKAYDEGKGVVALTAHTGCFEMLLHYWAGSGFKSFAIGRRLFDDRLDDLIKKMRSGPGIVYMYRDDSLRKIIDLLKDGRVMGALIDQDTNVDGVFSNFLGRPAYTPSGPIRLAMRFGLPVFVVTTYRKSNGIHYIQVSDRLILEDSGNRERDIVLNVEKANAIISKAIIQNPEQWVWMHKRWNRKNGDPDMRGIPDIGKFKTPAL